MTIGEALTIRSTALIIVMVIGILCGFVYHMRFGRVTHNTPPQMKRIRSKMHRGTLLEGDLFVSDTILGATLKNVRIPTYAKIASKRRYVRTMEVRAEEVIFEKGKPVQLIKPIVYRYSIDGRTAISRVSGDFGETKITEDTKEVQIARIWGHVRGINWEDPNTTSKENQ